jgi:hypothetical protein
MSKQPAGALGAFGTRPAPPPEQPPEAAKPAPALRGERKRGERDIVALSVRVTRSDWKRLSALAMDKGISLQALALKGFTKVLADEGMPPMERPNEK